MYTFGAKVQSTLSNLVHEHKLEHLLASLTPLAKTFHLSSRMSESSLLFQAHHPYDSRLSDEEFALALGARVLYPYHLGRTACLLCGLPADETVIHDLVCMKATNKRTSIRHTRVQDTITKKLSTCKSINSEKYTVDTTQVNYSQFFHARNPIAAAAGAPAHHEEDPDAGDLPAPTLLLLRMWRTVSQQDESPIQLSQFSSVSPTN